MLALGAVPFVDALAAAAPPSGIFRELDRQLRGDVVQRGAPGYNAARVLYDTGSLTGNFSVVINKEG